MKAKAKHRSCIDIRQACAGLFLAGAACLVTAEVAGKTNADSWPQEAVVPSQVFEVKGADLPRSERVRAFLEHWQRRRMESRGIQPLLADLEIKVDSPEAGVIAEALAEVGQLVVLPKFDDRLTGDAFVEDQVTRYVTKAREQGRIWCRLLLELGELGSAGQRIEALMEKRGAGLSLASEDPPEAWKGVIQGSTAFEDSFWSCQKKGYQP
jgi:hypothetical protein